MQNRVKARDSRKRVCLVAISYGGCLFFSSNGIRIKKNPLLLEILNARDPVNGEEGNFRACHTIRRAGNESCLHDPERGAEKISEG